MRPRRWTDEGDVVGRSERLNAVLPALVLVLVVLATLLSSRGNSVLGLSALAPLVAATSLSRKATLWYGVAAFVLTTGLGVYEQQYTAGAAVEHGVRLVAVVLSTVLAVVTCDRRLRREDQIVRLGAEAATTRAAVRAGETLQRALLGGDPRVPGLQTAARYLPGAREAYVGGDWYDAFPLADGRTLLVIGDVAGHDAPAAAAMAQIRGMLRALARSGHSRPGSALSALDDVRSRLGMDTLVTAIVATVDVRMLGGNAVPLHWSNAGHPPPVLVRADGSVEVLEREPDLLLGVSPGGFPRADHEVLLHRGDTLLLYTDGLVERRGMTLDDGTAWLVRALQDLGREPLDRMCDGLLSALGSRGDDDIALLAVRLPS